MFSKARDELTIAGAVYDRAVCLDCTINARSRPRLQTPARYRRGKGQIVDISAATARLQCSCSNSASARRLQWLSSSAPASTANADGHAPFTMGVIHVGSKTDAGYNQAHAEAAEFVQKTLPYVKVLEAENILRRRRVSRHRRYDRAGCEVCRARQGSGCLDPALEDFRETSRRRVQTILPASRPVRRLVNLKALRQGATYALGIAAGEMTRPTSWDLSSGFPNSQRCRIQMQTPFP